MHSDLYGALARDIEEVRSAVEKAIGCRLEFHDSAYHGGYYRDDLLNGENIIVKHNIDPFDGEAVESKFPQYPIIAYVNNTSRSSEIQSALKKGKPTLKLLRHT